MTRRVLFICTGNYYRSRFAELLFNALASRLALDWRADSRGIATELGTQNIGPISSLVIHKLQAMEIPLEGEVRGPLQLEAADLEAADLVIALNENEHRSWLSQRFSQWADQVRYWSVPDLNLMDAGHALSVIEENVTTLVHQLQEAATSRHG